MKENLDKFKISTMCRMLKVKRSGFYAWQRRPKSKRKIENEALPEKNKRNISKEKEDLWLSEDHECLAGRHESQ